MDKVLLKYQNFIDEIFAEYKFSLPTILRNLCLLLTENFLDASKVASYIHVGSNDFICKGSFGENFIARIEITLDNQTGILELWTNDKIDHVFKSPRDKEYFYQVIDLIIQHSQRPTSEHQISVITSDSQKDDTQNLKLSFYKLLQENRLKSYLYKNFYERDPFNVMKFRVKEVLLIGTLYDAFSLESEGNLSKQIFGEYSKLNLSSPPRITAVSSYDEAYAELKKRHFDLIINIVGLDKHTPVAIAKKLKSNFPFLPIYFLLNNNADIHYFEQFRGKDIIDRLFVWNGDSRVFLAMIKLLEDEINAPNDVKHGVRIILLVEDSPRYYSRYLPLLYSNVYQQLQRVLDNIIKDNDDNARVYALRMRPKIMLATNYEDAIDIFNKYKKNFLSLITDVEFYRNSKKDKQAGLDLADYISKNVIAQIPIIIQSSDESYKQIAKSKGFHFINKNSNTLSDDINWVIKHHMGFGDFIFKDQKGNPLGYVASNIDEFLELIKDPNKIPDESLVYHGSQNHISLWLTAQGELTVANTLAQLTTEDFADAQEIREFLIDLIVKMKKYQKKGKIVAFDPSEITEPETIVLLYPGALGGKGRGIAFIHSLIHGYEIHDFFPDIKIKTPLTFIIGTDQYDDFLEKNNLKELAFNPNTDYTELRKAFLKAKLTPDLEERLEQIVKKIKNPLAIRSSGLLEDSLFQPFAGIYETYIIPNNHPNLHIRKQQLADAIKMVYASIFSPKARSYINSINYKIEEEKMAIVIQEVVGRKFGDGKYFYPHISGIAQSYNFYTFSHLKPEDGYAKIALGLGVYVVEGEKAYPFCPKYPKAQNFTLKELVENSQTHFYAVDLTKTEIDFLKGETAGLAKLDIWDAERHGTLKHLASVYDIDNDRLIPGIDRPGPRVLDFADILKFNYIPLAETISNMLEITKEAMGIPVEIEFAVDLTKDKDGEASFYLLQVKPLLGSTEDFEIKLDQINKEKLILFTDESMGNGKIDYIKHIIFVDPDRFDKTQTEEIANEIEQLNNFMQQKGWRYILIGPGRWGTRDKWIGIPVNWGQISFAKVIVETSLKNFPLESSYGSHFFHNVISMNIGYFSVYQEKENHILRWDILKKQRKIKSTKFVDLVEFDKPLLVKMDGKQRIAIIEMQ